MDTEEAIKELSNHLKSYKPGYEGKFGNAVKQGIKVLEEKLNREKGNLK